MSTHVEAPVWWLEEGPEQCFNCEQFFHSEALIYCFGCDGPVCSHCASVILETRETYCSACIKEDHHAVAGDD